jgi:hypothetical protein
MDGDEEAGVDVAGIKVWVDPVEVGDTVAGFEGAVEGDDEAGGIVACAVGKDVMGFEGANEGDDEAGTIV